MWRKSLPPLGRLAYVGRSTARVHKWRIYRQSTTVIGRERHCPGGGALHRGDNGDAGFELPIAGMAKAAARAPSRCKLATSLHFNHHHHSLSSMPSSPWILHISFLSLRLSHFSFPLQRNKHKIRPRM